MRLLRTWFNEAADGYHLSTNPSGSSNTWLWWKLVFCCPLTKVPFEVQAVSVSLESPIARASVPTSDQLIKSVFTIATYRSAVWLEASIRPFYQAPNCSVSSIPPAIRWPGATVSQSDHTKHKAKIPRPTAGGFSQVRYMFGWLLKRGIHQQHGCSSTYIRWFLKMGPPQIT